MLSPIFEALMGDDRYERFDGVTNVLTISTIDYEIRVSSNQIRLDKVQFNMNLVNPHHGIPYSREAVALIDYVVFLESGAEEVFGITRDDVTTVVEYYNRSLK